MILYILKILVTFIALLLVYLFHMYFNLVIVRMRSDFSIGFLKTTAISVAVAIWLLEGGSY